MSLRPLRLFFALWPDEAEQLALAHAAHGATAAAGGRAIPPAKLHITLAFLGSVAASRLAELGEVASRSVGSVGLVPVTLDCLQHWPKAQLLCAAASQPATAAAALAAHLRSALFAAAFAPDLKPFRLHVTLARKVQRPHGEFCLAPVAWRFAELGLIESRSDASGSLYSTVLSWPLGKA